MSTHSQSTSLRIAVLGGGLNSAVGNVHRTSLRMVGQSNIIGGLFSRSHESNVESHNWWGGENSSPYKSLEEMIDRSSEFEAVLIITPPVNHIGPIRQFGALGKRILTDKPTAASSSELVDLVSSVPLSRSNLFTTYNYSGYPMIRELREIVLKGELGELLRVEISMQQEGFIRKNHDGTFGSPQPWRLVDGLIPTVSLDLGTHVLHLLHFITDSYLKSGLSVKASCGNFSVIDQVDFLGVLDSNILVKLGWGKSSLGYQNGLKLEVFGSSGSALWLQTAPEELNLADGQGTRRILARGNLNCKVANERRYSRFKGGHPSGFIEAFANVYEDILREDLTSSYALDSYMLENSISIMSNLEQLHQDWEIDFGGIN